MHTIVTLSVNPVGARAHRAGQVHFFLDERALQLQRSFCRNSAGEKEVTNEIFGTFYTYGWMKTDGFRTHDLGIRYARKSEYNTRTFYTLSSIYPDRN